VWNLPQGREGWVYAVGNPILWWSAALVSLAALFWVPVRWLWALRAGWAHPLRHAATMSPTAAAIAMSAVLPAATYAGFFTVHRVTFLFYMALVVPLLALPLAGALDAAWRRSVAWRTMAIVVVLAVLAAFLYYYPVASGVPIAPSRFHQIMRTVPWMSE
jgi:dolichyl-phosphate-mannose--protein O-mannosyl transferase